MKTNKSSEAIAVAEKIDLLFSSRRLFEQCEILRIPDAEMLAAGLKGLQRHIYALDKYFEKNWILSEEEITSCWAPILRSVECLTGDGQDVESMVRDIRAYQKLEEQIRRPEGYTPPDLFTYYHLKTCDVRLARALVARQSSRPVIIEASLRAWEYYDLISEACDDLADMREDLTTYNGNRFLLGVAIAGPQKTFREYLSFKKSLLAQISSYEKRAGFLPAICTVLSWAKKEAETLQELLQARSLEVQGDSFNLMAKAMASADVVQPAEQNDLHLPALLMRRTESLRDSTPSTSYS